MIFVEFQSIRKLVQRELRGLGTINYLGHVIRDLYNEKETQGQSTVIWEEEKNRRSQYYEEGLIKMLRASQRHWDFLSH